VNGGDDSAAEAAAVAEAAVVNSGGEVHPFTGELIARVGSGEMTADEAVAALLTRFVEETQSLTKADLNRAAKAAEDLDDPLVMKAAWS